MARPKEFDPEDVLDRVMDHFWVHGYDATSMDDLVKVAGVGRQSLYNQFGGKRELYLAALDRFAATDGSTLFPILAQEGPVKKVLESLFDEVIELVVSDNEGKGCMLANAATTLAAADVEVKKRVCAANDGLERAIVKRLQTAKKDGELSKRHDPIALGRFFAATIAGIRTTAKTVRDRKHLASIAEVALTVLG